MAAATAAPEWCVAEMPPGYRTRFEEIQRLLTDLRSMDRIGRLLWEIGEPLNEAVGEVFASLKYDVESAPGGDAAQFTVKLDAGRRLLLHVAPIDGPVQKKSDELAQMFQLVHQVAGEHDRVILIADSDRGRRPADRAEPVTPEAVSFVQRMGVNVLKTHTLFTLWRISLQDHARARTLVDRLHAQDGGLFSLPTP
jgi:hypothetical protein